MTATLDAPGGFTLVEMLVAVALVVLIMGMFAQAFQVASGLLLRHRGTAENNQRARAVVAILEADLAKRTFRQRDDALTQRLFAVERQPPQNLDERIAQAVDASNRALLNTSNQLGNGIVPLHPDYFLPGVGGRGRAVDGDRERGYLEYSENDPFNDADDTLQLTVNASITDLGNEDTTPYTGRARMLGPTWNNGPVNVDQPVWDDGIAFNTDVDGNVTSYGAGQNGTSKSRYAEISYFIRNGNLMRRVLLIRDPGITNPPGPIGDEAQPTRGDGVEFIPGNYPQTDFWNDLDFSATRFDPEFDADKEPSRMRFNTAADLDNSTVYTSGLKPHALGNPQNRFGHDPSPRRAGGGLQGRPKEFLFPGMPASFIGRYTLEESSHPGFGFPGVLSAVPDPLNVVTPMSPEAHLAIANMADANGNSKVDAFEDAPPGEDREGEDILMTNVHAFDVKVWDAAMSEWVDIGHTRSVKRDFNGTGDVNVGDPSNSFNDDIPERGDWHLSRVFDPTLLQGTFQMFDGNGVVVRFQSARRGMYRYGSMDYDGQTPQLINRVFDTWHPQFNFDASTDLNGRGQEDALDDPPPFRPLWTDRDNFDMQSANGFDVEVIRGADPSQGNKFNRRMLPVVWSANAAYDTLLPQNYPNDQAYDLNVPPCRVFPFPRARADDISTGQFYPGDQSLFYQVVGVQDFDNDGLFASGDTEPAWPIVPGEEVQDGELRWRAFNNTIGLQAVRITIRFLDPSSQQMRQVTVTHSFVEL